MIKQNQHNTLPLLLLFSSIVLVFQGVFANDLPDELDYRKYWDQYIAAKQHSDTLRERADEKQQELFRKQEDIAQTKRGIRKNREDIISYEEGIEDLRAHNRRLGSQISQLKDTNEGNRKTIKELQKDLPDLRKKEERAREKVHQLKSKREGLVKKKVAALHEHRKTTKKKNEAFERLEQVKKKERKLAKTVKNHEKTIAHVTLKLAEKRKKKKKFKKQLDEIEDKESDRAKKLKKKIKKLTESIDKDKKQLKKLNLKLSEIKVEHQSAQKAVNKAQEKFREDEKKFQETKAKLSKANKKLMNLDEEIKAAQEKRNHIAGKLDKKKRRIKNLKNQTRNNETKIVNKKDKIKDNRDRIVSYQNYIEDLRDHTRRLRKRLPRLEEEEERFKGSYARLDEEASIAERQTAQRQSAYKTVKAAYDRKVREAKDFGLQSGRQDGSQKGESLGLVDGSQSGQKEGAFQGKDDGLMYGYLKGKDEGYRKGKDDGYRDGLATPGKEEAGYKAGRIQGDKDALQEAKKVDYQQGRKDKREALMKRPLREVDMLNESFEAVMDSLSRFTENPVVTLGEGQDFVSELREEMGFHDVGILKAHNMNLNVQPHSRVGLICQKIAGKGGLHKVVPSSQDNCRFTYREINHFCKISYKDAYKSSFKTTYRSAYKSSKYQACSVHYPSAFEAHKTKRYNEGFNEVYRSTYNEWKEKGAHEIWSQGYKKGYKQAYEENLERYRKEQYALGLQDEEDFFRNHPVLVFHKLLYKKLTSRVPGSIVAGDKFSLSVDLANFGFVPTKNKAVTLKFEALTDNISIPSHKKVIDLKALPAETLSHVKDISSFQISETAFVAQKAELLAKAYFPNGEVKKIKLVLSISDLLQLNMKKVWYADRLQEHTTSSVRVTLENRGDNDPVGPVTVSLEMDSSYRKYLRIKNSSVSIAPSSLRARQQKVVRLRVSALKNTSGKKVPVVLKVRYKGSVMLEQTLWFVVTRRSGPF